MSRLLRVALPPPPEPVLEELLLPSLRDYLRIVGTGEDPLLVTCLAAARSLLEGRDGISRRVLLNQTWDWTIDGWPSEGPLEPPLAPLQSVTAITVTDPDGIPNVWPSTNYEVTPGDGLGRIQPKPNVWWPAHWAGLGAITVRFVAGYGVTLDTVPPSLLQWLRGKAGEYYTSRDAAAPPLTWLDNLLEPYCLRTL